jgi:flagellar FliL protein
MSPKDEKPAKETPSPEAEPAKKKKIPPIAIYAVAGVVLLVAGYFVGTKFLGGSKSGEEAKTEESKDAKAEGKEKEKEKKKSKDEKPSAIFTMEDIIVNPAGTSGTRFLSISIGFEVGSPESLKLFEERQPLIKDALITILGSKTMEQLSDPKQKEITRFQIKKRVEQLLEVEDLAAVYFTDFILQ